MSTKNAGPFLDSLRNSPITQSIWTLLNRFIHRRKRSHFKKRGVLERSVEDRFTWMYRNRYWGDSETPSGAGSKLAQTETIRRELPKLVEAYAVGRILDAPCGDLNWMRLVLPEIGVHYVGGDIVRDIIDEHQAKYASDHVSFVHLDIINDRLPVADLMICRDCLFHFSFADTHRFLRNFIESGIPYLLTTTHLNTEGFANTDIATGLFRRIDLFQAPYSFPTNPLTEFEDWAPPEPARKMCLWSRAQVVEALDKAAWQTAPDSLIG